MPRNLFDRDCARDYWREFGPTAAFAALCALTAVALIFVAFTLGAKYGASSVKVPTQRPLQIECVPVPGMDAKQTIRNAS
jgi:hypothetical protein